ncbi:MAG: phosphoenolpyruvate carboxylase [Candidatus Caenarcaniphilales bacterium]|nr:phosphoenolpyruvate carboxylase [Candidatus Caenarcaniphilales bacterium]
MNKKKKDLKAFNDLVSMKYQIYNGLFVTLPFDDLENTGAHLAMFSSNLKEKLENKITPIEIVENFFAEVNANRELKDKPERADPEKKSEENIRDLFRILQFVERQVVLFDALEEAAFEFTHDSKGSGSIEYLINRLDDSKQLDNLAKELTSYKTRIVLTAHPTQFYPGTVLGILSDLATSIKENKLEQIHKLLMQMGKTRFKNRKKPSPLDEAKSLVWYLENIFYEVLPQIKLKIEASLETQEKSFGETSLLELGFWPGGDRDGNPFVTTQITKEVASILKNSLLKLYRQDIKALQRRLTFDGVYEQLAEIEKKLNESTKLQLCQIENDLPETSQSAEGVYSNPKELLSELKRIRQNLIEQHLGLFINHLDELIAKVQIFGFHFASLDLRQDSRIHSQVLSEILEKENYSSLSPGERKEFVLKLIEQKKKIEASQNELSTIASETLLSLNELSSIQEENGEKGLHRYIISNTQSSLNVFEVLTLSRFANCEKKGWNLKDLKLDIVPLFETVDDLENAEAVMDELYQNKLYSEHLKQRNKTQIIMVGFSDGTKDGGYLTANWSIYLAKRRLTQLSKKHGIKVIFFDGRGGPPSRGGGNTHEFYRSMGNHIQNDEIQLTIQGQTISSNFGSQAAAFYNLEQLFTAGLEKKLFSEETYDLTDKDISLMNEISKECYKAYLELRNDPLFVPYLEEVTPLRYYDMLNFASRPTKRNKSTKLKFEDLRAISFVGAWTQMKQNIAGFYGLGAGLEILSKQGKLKELQNLYSKSIFFKTLIENAMQSLSKSFFPLTYYLEKDKKFHAFWQKLYSEAQLTEQMLKTVSGQKQLMEQATISRESIQLREKIILPLLIIQHYALCKLREADEEDKETALPLIQIEALQKIVVKSLAANINASRNSV